MNTTAPLPERTLELAAAAVRAEAGEADIAYRGGRLHRDGVRLPLFAPHLHPTLDADDAASFRGAADGVALRLRLSDGALHESLAPEDAVERLVFGWLEQYRVESQVPAPWPGAAHNLRHRHEAWSAAFHRAGHTASPRGLMLYTLAQVARARIVGGGVAAETEDLIEASRYALAPRIGVALAGMRRHRDEQRAFAAHALDAARTVAAMLRAAGGGDGGRADDLRPDDAVRNIFGLLMDQEPTTLGERYASEVGGARREAAAAGDAYRVFTGAFDREAAPEDLVRAGVLQALRQRLDARVAAHGIHIARLARELQRLYAVPQDRGWDGAQEEGRINGRALARLVASPGERRLFRQERRQPVGDAAVTFLIDCSGSMKTQAGNVAVLVDAFSRALELAGIAGEVLGFTTGAWNGGRAQREWLRAGRPAAPGRLNERLHLVLKPFDVPWRRGRRGIAALLREELFREGLDGEAVDWAASRLLARGEPRKVLVVVSDGSPMDGATALANGPRYLDTHLHSVVARIERAGRIEVHGIGVGRDLSASYRSSRQLDAADLGARVGQAMCRQVIELLGRRG